MKRRTIVGLAVGVVAVAAIAAGVWWFFGQQRGAEATARDYLEALAAGDYAAIDALRAEPLDDSVVEQALAGASARVTDARVVEVTERDGGAADVRAEVDLAGRSHDLAFTLERVGDRWVLSGDDLGSLQANSFLAGAPVGDSVRIGDALAVAGADVRLLPAEYEVTPPAPGLLTGSAMVAVLPGAPATIEIEATLSAEATSQAQQQLDSYLDECTKAATAVPSNCGIRVPWAADLTSLDSIAFRIEERPVLALSEDATGFEATGGVIVATATGASRAGGTASFTYRADDWAVRGSVRFEGDQMVLSVR